MLDAEAESESADSIDVSDKIFWIDNYFSNVKIL